MWRDNDWGRRNLIEQWKLTFWAFFKNGIFNSLCHQSYCPRFRCDVPSLLFIIFPAVNILRAFRVRIDLHEELHTTSYFINEWLMSNVLESNRGTDEDTVKCRYVVMPNFVSEIIPLLRIKTRENKKITSQNYQKTFLCSLHRQRLWTCETSIDWWYW